MEKRVEFFYDYVSPYSYLANSQVEKIAGDRLVYRPMFLAGVMQVTGNRQPGALEVRGTYLSKDIDRWAKYYGIEYKHNPKFPLNTLQALRLAIVAQHDRVFDRIHAALFEASFIGQLDLGDAAVLATIVGSTGLDEESMLARTSEQSVKDELKSNTDEAIARGAFGAPTFFVGDEMFFGNDRFEFIREALWD
jgi:2-hydroxychromene-2-carboxylate isomerase